MAENKEKKQNNKNSVYRKETLERISSPEQLTNYLKVTNVSIWAVLVTVILILVGILVWSGIGTLETKKDAVANVTNSKAEIIIASPGHLKEGYPVRLQGKEYKVSTVEVDEYGRTIAYAEMEVPDGDYKVEVVTDQIHPIQFLLTNQN